MSRRWLCGTHAASAQYGASGGKIPSFFVVDLGFVFDCYKKQAATRKEKGLSGGSGLRSSGGC